MKRKVIYRWITLKYPHWPGEIYRIPYENASRTRVRILPIILITQTELCACYRGCALFIFIISVLDDNLTCTCRLWVNITVNNMHNNWYYPEFHVGFLKSMDDTKYTCTLMYNPYQKHWSQSVCTFGKLIVMLNDNIINALQYTQQKRDTSTSSPYACLAHLKNNIKHVCALAANYVYKYQYFVEKW